MARSTEQPQFDFRSASATAVILYFVVYQLVYRFRWIRFIACEKSRIERRGAATVITPSVKRTLGEVGETGSRRWLAQSIAYDAFISYSTEADYLLARDLEGFPCRFTSMLHDVTEEKEMSNYLSSLLTSMPTRRSLFVSYHHDNDQFYYDQLGRVCDQACQLVRDASLREPLDSEDGDYIGRAIREGYITGTSCTIVLCGAETWKRKHVDWEIKATLDKQHSLVGVNLPSNPLAITGKYTVPDRLHENIQSGYAVWTDWITFTSSIPKLKEIVESAISRPSWLIRNSAETMARNLS